MSSPASFRPFFILFVLLGSALDSVLPCAAQTPIHSSIAYDGGNPANGIFLTWEAIPGKQYNVLTTTALGQQPWQALNPAPLTASNNLVQFRDQNDQTARFYKVVKLDTPIQTIANMVWIQSGTFTMGSPASEALRDSDEGPKTEVTISQGFWMGRYEVTQGEYLAVMGSNPSDSTGDLNRPVEQVSWDDAVAYCAALTTREGQAGRLPAGYIYRLPTEAEWEYACRAGTTTGFHYGPALRSGMANFYAQREYDSSVGDIYNPDGAYLGRTTAVGSYAPNAWGLYDMHGNVFEWCSDRYGVYPGGSVTDPLGLAMGSNRVIRGGSWYDNAWNCRSADRGNSTPVTRYGNVGVRPVLAPGQ